MPMGRFSVGVQLFSVKDILRAEPERFPEIMSRIKELGYEGVEFAGLYGLEPQFIHDILCQVGLIPISAHIQLTEMLEDLDKVVRDYSTIGCGYAAIPILPPEYRYVYPGYGRVLEAIPSISKALAEAGITLMFHNHDFDFTKMQDGQYGLDDLLGSFPSDVIKAELDTCWLEAGGQRPVEYIEKYSGRLPVLHLKDMVLRNTGRENPGRQYKGELEFQPVGFGQLLWEPILNAAERAGTKWVIVEDESDKIPGIECIRRSRQYLKILGL